MKLEAKEIIGKKTSMLSIIFTIFIMKNKEFYRKPRRDQRIFDFNSKGWRELDDPFCETGE